MEPADELAARTRRLHPAVEAGDAAAVERHTSHRPHALFIGTDPAEWWESPGPFLAAAKAGAEGRGAQVRILPDDARAHREGGLDRVVDSGPTFRFPATGPACATPCSAGARTASGSSCTSTPK